MSLRGVTVNPKVSHFFGCKLHKIHINVIYNVPSSSIQYKSA